MVSGLFSDAADFLGFGDDNEKDTTPKNNRIASTVGASLLAAPLVATALPAVEPVFNIQTPALEQQPLVLPTPQAPSIKIPDDFGFRSPNAEKSTKQQTVKDVKQVISINKIEIIHPSSDLDVDKAIAKALRKHGITTGTSLSDEDI